MLLPQMNLANRHDIDLTDNNRQPNLICVFDKLSEIVRQQLLEPLQQTERKHMCDDLQRCVVAMIFGKNYNESVMKRLCVAKTKVWGDLRMFVYATISRCFATNTAQPFH